MIGEIQFSKCSLLFNLYFILTLQLGIEMCQRASKGSLEAEILSRGSLKDISDSEDSVVFLIYV